MIKFNCINYLNLLSLLAVGLILAGCDPVGSKKCYPCPMAPIQEPGFNFSVVDKTTGNNLFFGSSAIYKQAQVKVYHIVNGQPDSVHLVPDTAHGTFRMSIPPVHNTDTVTMNIAGLPQDVFLFKTTMSGGCCSTFTFNGVMYNGATIFTPTNGPNIVIIQK